jgi:hypothetical protein
LLGLGPQRAFNVMHAMRARHPAASFRVVHWLGGGGSLKSRAAGGRGCTWLGLVRPLRGDGATAARFMHGGHHAGHDVRGEARSTKGCFSASC